LAAAMRMVSQQNQHKRTRNDKRTEKRRDGDAAERAAGTAGARGVDRLRAPVQLRLAAVRTETSPLPCARRSNAVDGSSCGPIMCIA
jgi:hypothetical protein